MKALRLILQNKVHVEDDDDDARREFEKEFEKKRYQLKTKQFYGENRKN